MSSPKKRSDTSTDTIIVTTEMMIIIAAPSVVGQMTETGIVGRAEGTMRKTDTTGEATMTTAGAQNLQHTLGLHHRPAVEDHPLRTVNEEADLPPLTIAAALDHRFVSKQTVTASITEKVFPLIALRLVAILLPLKRNPKTNPEI